MDLQKFLNASLSHREATIEVPELADFFAEGEKPEWVVRSLTAAELGRAKESASRSDNVQALVEAAAGKGDKAEAIRKVLGVSGNEVPADVSYRIGMLVSGSVSPVIGEDNRDVVVRLAENFPTVFYALTTKILNLTGQGAEVGKRKPSGKTQKSED
jgi:hypothetical protein